MAHNETGKKKYKISEALAKYTADIQTAKRAEIREACAGVTKATLSVWENIPFKSTTMIPFDHGIEICRILGIKSTEFINT